MYQFTHTVKLRKDKIKIGTQVDLIPKMEAFNSVVFTCLRHSQKYHWCGSPESHRVVMTVQLIGGSFNHGVLLPQRAKYKWGKHHARYFLLGKLYTFSLGILLTPSFRVDVRMNFN